MSTKIDVDKLDFAFQPIVNSDTGIIYTVEALIMGLRVIAENQTPLTKLPGNKKIDDFIINSFQKTISRENLIAHIGGDNFFLGFINHKYEDVYKLMINIQNEFKNSVSSLYHEKDLLNDGIEVKDKYGAIRKFNLLSIACAIIEINQESSINNFNLNLGPIKKKSKEQDYPYGVCTIM